MRFLMEFKALIQPILKVYNKDIIVKVSEYKRLAPFVTMQA